MNWNGLLRSTHRWLGMALVALTIINVVVFGMGYAIEWLYYVPLAPLFLSMLTGLYLFALPYVAKARRSGEGA